MSITKELFNKQYFDNKSILITGGTGTLGNTLTKHFLLNTNCKKVCIFSRDEFKQHEMKNRLRDHKNFDKLRFFIGDIRDTERIAYALTNIDIVFHAAALKQVDAIEYNPMEAIKTNIDGTKNVIDGCINKNVKQLIGISTDKCVEPVNLYGATKLCLEKLIVAAHEYSGHKLNTCVLRYGNVIGSRGSVVPFFKKIEKTGEFTVTDERMTRFTLTIDDAANFILNCVSIAKGGEIFVPKLKKYTIVQLCEVLNSNNTIKVIGIRPGEKLHEVMISKSESLNTWEGNSFFVVQPRWGLNKEFVKEFKLEKSKEIFSYSSEDAELISNDNLKQQIDSSV